MKHLYFTGKPDKFSARVSLNSILSLANHENFHYHESGKKYKYAEKTLTRDGEYWGLRLVGSDASQVLRMFF